MSAPLVLDASQLQRLAMALEALTRMTREHLVYIDSYSPAGVAIDNVTLSVRWDNENDQYIVDNRIGQ